VIDRRRIALVNPSNPLAKQPYHAARDLKLRDAEDFIRRCRREARLLARRDLSEVAKELEKRGHKVVGCGILLGSGRPATSLVATLASHALIHTAEGELFRVALIRAAEHCRWPVMGIRERELWARGAAELEIPADSLPRRVTELGRFLGPPWRQDEKLATLVGWLALCAHSR
jgi:hypothetical protein